MRNTLQTLVEGFTVSSCKVIVMSGDWKQGWIIKLESIPELPNFADWIKNKYSVNIHCTWSRTDENQTFFFS